MKQHIKEGKCRRQECKVGESKKDKCSENTIQTNISLFFAFFLPDSNEFFVFVGFASRLAGEFWGLRLALNGLDLNDAW